MTDEEFYAEISAVVEHFTGVTTALTQVIQALQAQPGFDHQEFLRRLAVFQVSAEGTPPPGRERFHAAHHETFERFAKPQSPLPPLAGSPPS